MDETDRKEIMIEAREKGPGPGRYGLPSGCGFPNHTYNKKRAPAYSFRPRLGDSMFKKDCSPGPGYMVDATMTRNGKEGSYKYSILGRNKDGSTFKTPAPGTYRPEIAHPQGERHAPAYSMGSRSRYRKRDTVPAPNSNSLPPLIGPKIPVKSACASFSFTGRSKVGNFAEDLAKTPGPCKYNTTDPSTYKNKAPQYSCQGRTYMPGDTTQKPGPGTYRPENVYITKRQAPAASMGIRHSEFTVPLIIDVMD